MTRIQVLQDARAEWVQKSITQKEVISDIYSREQNAVRDALLPFFADFSEGVTVEVHRGSVYFKMAHPEYSYLKELFNLYLREDRNEDGPAFKAVDLSYYTTQTNGDNVWELNRLRLLGKLAEVVEDNQFSIVYAANKAVADFKEEYRIADQLHNMISTAIGDIDVRIRQLTKEKVLFDLSRDGVEFTEGVSVQMKHNYSPRVKSVKLIDFSKSKKKATAVFEFGHGSHTSREENVSVESIVDQVAHYYPKYVKDIVQEVELA